MKNKIWSVMGLYLGLLFGCTSYCIASGKAIPVFANADTIAYTGTNSLCPGGTLLLSLNNLPAKYIVTWYLNNAIIPGALNDTLKVVSAGSYSAKATNGTVTVSYPALVVGTSTIPVAGFTNTAIGGCPSSSIKFTSTSTGPGLKYLWNFDDPNSGKSDTSSLVNPAHFFVGNHGNGIQIYNVTLTVTNNAGCTSNVFTTPVTLKQSPSTGLAGTGSVYYNGLPYFVMCSSLPSSFLFKNASTTANVYYTIKWGDKSPDFKGTNFTGQTHTYDPGLYTLFFTVTGTNGCTNTETYYVFVGTAPQVTVLKPLQNICAGQSQVFNINGPNQNSKGTTYTVTYSDGLVAKYTNPFDTLMHTFKLASVNYTATTSSGTYNNAYTVTISAANPCGTSTADAGPLYVSNSQQAGFRMDPADTTAYINAVKTLTYTGTLGYTVTTGGTAYLNKLVWKVAPSNGYTSGSSLGSDNNSNDPQQWTSGVTDPAIIFTKTGKYVITQKTGNRGCGIDSVKTDVCIENSAVASFSADKTQVCSGSAVQFTNTSLPGICGIKQPMWAVTYINNSNCAGTSNFNFIDGTTAASQNPRIVFSNPGVYQVSLLITNPDKTISPVYSQNITVAGLPQVKIISVDTLCFGTGFTPAATASNCTAAPASSYEWLFPDANMSSSNLQFPPEITYGSPGIHQVKLIVSSACGFVTDSVNVYVKPSLVTNTPQSKSYCSGIIVPAVNFTKTTPGEGFKWSNDKPVIGLSSSGTGDIPSFTTDNQTNGDVVANISITPYSGSCIGQTVTYKITVNPKLSIPIVNTPVNLCLGSNSNALSAMASTGNYLSWYSDNALTNKLGAAPIPGTAVVQSVTYYVTQTNPSGCEGPPAAVVVNIIAPVSNNIIKGDQHICFGNQPEPLTSGAVLQGGNGSFIYQWQISTDQGASWAEISGAQAPSYIPVIAAGAVKYRRLVKSGTCSSVSNEINIIYEQEITNFEIVSGNQVIAKNMVPLIIKAQESSAGNASVTYQWEQSADNLNYTFIDNANEVNYQPGALAENTFFKRLTISKECTVSSSEVEILIKELVSIPNAFTPNGDGINDEWNIKGFEDDRTVTLKVFNRYGSIVLDARDQLPAWKGTYNGRMLPAGTYYYILSAKDYKTSGYVVIIY